MEIQIDPVIVKDVRPQARHIVWGAAIAYVALITYLVLMLFSVPPERSDLPAGIFSIATFLIVQIVWSECRFETNTPLCPGTLAQFLFATQIVLMPMLIILYRASIGTLPWLPSKFAINFTLSMISLSYLAFSAAYHYTSLYLKRSVIDSLRSSQIENTTHKNKVEWLILPYIALGAVGLFLYHGSLQGYITYLTNPASTNAIKEESTTLSSAASIFLRPFIGFGIIMAWCLWIDRKKNDQRFIGLGTLLIFIALPLVNTFGYNRGSIVAPIIAMAATYSLRVRRLTFKLLATAGCILFIFTLAAGAYREVSDDDIVNSVLTSSNTGQPNAVAFVQIYSVAPQFTGFLIEETGFGSKLYWGSTLVSSALYPVPILGKPFRQHSGPTIYNEAIYAADNPGVTDQILPYVGELFINFHIPGVLCGFLLLGYIIAQLQKRFMTARSTIDAYCWFFISFWILFPGNVSVTSQFYIYFAWPIYIYKIYTNLHSYTQRVFGVSYK
jgi:hypothetical protein